MTDLTLPANLDAVLRLALDEDIGSGDITTLATVPDGTSARATITAKEAGIVAGLAVAARVYTLLDGSVRFEACNDDGVRVAPGAVVARLEGPARPILTGERVAMNLLQRLSGIATRTMGLVERIADTRARLVDTRKTTPGLRSLEKWAVRAGGGFNHRHGLYDAVLIKENHIVAAGGIQPALHRARAFAPHTSRIEIEIERLDQIEPALGAGADVLLLDNMTPAELADAVGLIGGRALTEASGNVTEETIRSVAESGVDIISVGALTHSVRALDLSLRITFAGPMLDKQPPHAAQ
jgi:nicotinate-nucleotide pyrophosphorylase (carboxylating)